VSSSNALKERRRRLLLPLKGRPERRNGRLRLRKEKDSDKRESRRSRSKSKRRLSLSSRRKKRPCKKRRSSCRRSVIRLPTPLLARILSLSRSNYVTTS